LTTSEILNDYNKQLEESEICYKNNHGNQHDWESVNREHISKDIVEILCFCCICGAEKFVYDYLLEYEI
jgi:hypothetical protein